MGTATSGGGRGPEIQFVQRELDEARAQQAATAAILRTIQRSPHDAQPVFDMIASNAARLCQTEYCHVFRFDGRLLHIVAHHGLDSDGFRAVGASWPMAPDRGTAAGRAILSRAIEQIPDVRDDTDYVLSDVAGRAGFRSTTAVPMMLPDARPLGVITVMRSQTGTLATRHVELLKTFADQAVIAIENVRLFEEVEAHNREVTEALERQTATAEVLRVIASDPADADRVLQTIVDAAKTLFKGSKAVATRIEDGKFRIAVVAGDQAEEVANALAGLNVDETTVTGQAATEQQTVQVDDIAIATEAYENARTLSMIAGTRTVCATPLLRAGETIGTISIVRDRVLPLTADQIGLLESFADQAVIAIKNAQLLNDLRELLQQQTATGEVLKIISRSAFDLDAVLKALVESAIEICRASSCHIYLRSGDLYRPVMQVGHSKELDDFMRQNPMRPGRGSATSRVALTKAVVHIRDVLEDPEYAFREGQRIGGYRTTLGVPLLRDGEVVGVFTLARRVVEEFSQREIELIEAFSDQAVIAIENARLVQELRESLSRETATADVLKVISRSAFDLKTVLQTLVESAVRLSDAEMGTITRMIDGVFYRAEAFGFSDAFVNVVRDIPIALDRGSISGRALLEKRTVHIPDVESDSEYTFEEGKRLGGFRTVLGVPMMREGNAIGVLSLGRQDVRPFTGKQIELVSTFADQAAIAIENVRLFEEVRARTEELSRSLQELRTAQDRLVQTEKLASLGQLTAGIAHEIKNPLNFVNNFSSLSAELVDELGTELDGLDLTSEQRAGIDEVAGLLRGNIERIVQHGRRADSIVKNMLLHSRQGSGKHRPADINALVEESLNLAYHGARAEWPGFNISIDKSLDPEAGQADLFPQEITRVLLNLISNGFYAASKRKEKADGAGYEPTLTATTKSLGDSVEIRIRDNGTGIPPDVRDKLFTPFFTTKPVGEGTGLGLSISHDIVAKQHAGSISVASETGSFTEFRIVLPRNGATLGEAGGGK